MSKELLTNRLVTTKSFAPGEGSGSHGASGADAAGDSLDGLVRREEEETKQQSIAEAWEEVRRQRGEVLVEVDRAIQILEKRRTEAEEMLRTLSHRRGAVEAIDVDRPMPPVLGDLRQMKQDLHDAHVELTVFQRIESATAPGRVALADLTAGELSRAGWALFWPIVLGMLVAAVVIVVGIRMALTV